MQKPSLDVQGTLRYPDGSMFFTPKIATVTVEHDELSLNVLCPECGVPSDNEGSLCSLCQQRYHEEYGQPTRDDKGDPL